MVMPNYNMKYMDMRCPYYIIKRKSEFDIQIVTGVNYICTDFVIPKGWSVMVFTSATHLDEKYYPQPLKFYPWQWQKAGDVRHLT